MKGLLRLSFSSLASSEVSSMRSEEKVLALSRVFSSLGMTSSSWRGYTPMPSWREALSWMAFSPSKRRGSSSSRSSKERWIPSSSGAVSFPSPLHFSSSGRVGGISSLRNVWAASSTQRRNSSVEKGLPRTPSQATWERRVSMFSKAPFIKIVFVSIPRSFLT